jgi:hypothetical protein
MGGDRAGVEPVVVRHRQRIVRAAVTAPDPDRALERSDTVLLRIHEETVFEDRIAEIPVVGRLTTGGTTIAVEDSQLKAVALPTDGDRDAQNLWAQRGQNTLGRHGQHP